MAGDNIGSGELASQVFAICQTFVEEAIATAELISSATR